MPGALRACAVALVATLAAGCAPEFDKVSEIRSLRVLAVQKDPPYAKRGDGDPLTTDDAVNLSILWRDAAAPDKAGRPVEVLWLAACFNPPGDVLFSCFAGLDPSASPILQQRTCPSASPDEPCNTFSFEMPPDILQRPRASDPTQTPYGLAYVFFAVCAGKLSFEVGPNQRDFPFACRDQSGNRLGPEDFVAGYTAVYAYETVENANPPVEGIFFKDEEIGPGCQESPDPEACLKFRCIDDECLDLRCAGGMCRNLEQEWSQLPCGEIKCVPRCSDDGEDSCPPHEIRPKLGEGYAELDSLSNETRGRNITEQMWINYYVERVPPLPEQSGGGVKSEVRLLNDAFTGPNADYGTEFYAPKDPGLTIIWSAVHDNRGGVSWVGLPVKVE